MEKMTKKDKFKKFVYDHRETIAKVTVYTTLIVGSIAIIAKANSQKMEDAKESVSDYNSWAGEENEWLDEQEAEDKLVYLLHDWSYLVIPKETETEWIKDRAPRLTK